MTQINGAAQTSASVPNATTQTAPPPAAESQGSFESFVKGLLSPGSDGSVSEEELFAALTGERIGAAKGSEALAKYTEAFEAEKRARQKPDGYIPFEDAAKGALATLVQSGVVTQEEGDKIYSEAFSAAQLDSNTAVLFDDRGGAGDPTIAVETMEKALLLSKAAIESFTSGQTKAEARSYAELSATKATILGGSSAPHSASPPTATHSSSGSVSQGSAIDGGGGFLFKPISDSDGKLAILSTERLAGKISEVVLKLGDKEIETGRYTGNGNGGRDHFRFSKSGGNYPKDLVVEMVLKNGERVKYDIPDPSRRYD
jgi:hypothetical protein